MLIILLTIFFEIPAESKISSECCPRAGAADLTVAGVPEKSTGGAVVKTMFSCGSSIFWKKFVFSEEAQTFDDIDLMPLKDFCLKCLPLIFLISIVLGGIYGGIFTPIEAGAIGSLGAVIIGILKRRLSMKVLWEVLVETGYITATISFIIIAAQMYARMLALSEMPAEFGSFVVGSDLSIMGIIILYIILIILMGTILDSGSIMLILVPLMYPILVSLNIDLIWFGIVTVIAVEVGLLTPPLGISIFVIKSSLDNDKISLGDIFAGAAPFALMMVAVLFLVISFPILTTILL